MISVDAAGNVWVVDTGRHQVLKFAPGGQLLMAVGTELTPGSGPEQFCQPTQVSVLRDGSFLVADGYCNNRVVLFDSAGKFVAESVPIPAVVHSVLVDECEEVVYVASREAATVLALHLNPNQRLQLQATYDLAAQGHGQAWALGFGPYGEQLVLMWRQGQDARLVNVRFPEQFWTLPGTAQLSPHDFQLGGAPMQLSGAGDRFHAVYLTSVGVACDKECGPLRKFVLVPGGMQLPNPADLPATSDVTDIHPGDAKLLPGGTAISEQPHHHEEIEKEKKAQAANGPAATGADGNAAAAAAGDEGAGEGQTEGGAMVADDYDEEVEGDSVDAEDYEESKEYEQDMQDYYGETKTAPTKAPLEKERFEVLVQDKKVVEQSTSVSGWAIALVVVLAALMAFSVLRFAKLSLSAYLHEDTRGGAAGGAIELGQPHAGGGAHAKGAAAPAAPASGKRSGMWEMAEGLMSRMHGGVGRAGGRGVSAGSHGGAGGRSGRVASREVEAARERERLLRSEP
ncbi:hypothetical protein Vafri_17608 [Volvox africanus]|nr:hypothetical protein Vafri_17608 [Volvox africanus]